MARSLTAAFLGALVAGTVAASAAGDDAVWDRAIRLTWNAPTDCPGAAEVVEDARGLVTHRGALARGPAVVVTGVVERVTPSRWTLTLTVGDGREHVEASSCADLARAGALFLALLVDSETASAPSAAPPAPAPASSGVAATHPEATDSAAAPSGSDGAPTVSVLAAAGILLDVGTLPRPRVLGVVEGGLRVHRFDAAIDVAVGLPQDTDADGAAGAHLMALSAIVKPCYAVWSTSWLRVEPCLPIEIGWFHAQGIGIADSRASDSAWASVGGALALGFRLSERLEARIDVAALVPVVKPDFELTGIGTVFEPSVAVRAGTAAVVHF